jgi:hypothetical protein
MLIGTLAGLGTGAVAMYVADPSVGRRRRALVRDKFGHVGHLLTRRAIGAVERRGRFLLGVGRGVRHHVTEPFNRKHVDSSDDVLVARIRSEVLRRADIPAGQILVDAHAGCVTLRGQLEHAEDVRRLVDRAAHVTGVREVRNYLHLPDAAPPNKADAYEEAARHLPSV